MVDPAVLAARLRMVMGAQQLSRKRLSLMTGICRPSLSTKLEGQVAFTYDELTRLVAALDLEWGRLLADCGDF